jgi:AraC-like DNA-binding protein
VNWALLHLEEDLTIPHLADHAGVSPRTLTRLWRQETGVSPHQWLLTARINRARELLETTDLQVEQIAVRCGLGSGANMRARFRDALGITPTAYRRTFQRSATAGRAGLAGQEPPRGAQARTRTDHGGRDMVIVRRRSSGHGLPDPWIVADFLRMENGVLAKHWDVIEDEASRAQSGLDLERPRCIRRPTDRHRLRERWAAGVLPDRAER